VVEITWDAPTSNGGSPILSYQVVVRHSDGVAFSEDTVNCNGAESQI